jgi:hypothetical protein
MSADTHDGAWSVAPETARWNFRSPQQTRFCRRFQPILRGIAHYAAAMLVTDRRRGELVAR